MACRQSVSLFAVAISRSIVSKEPAFSGAQKSEGRSIEGAGARTQDLRIKSPLLYRLSYAFWYCQLISAGTPSIASRTLPASR